MRRDLKMQSNKLTNKEIRAILNKHKEAFFEMEHYDRTREILWKRKKIYLTLTHRVIKRLEELRAKTGKPISRIVEDAVVKAN